MTRIIIPILLIVLSSLGYGDDLKDGREYGKNVGRTTSKGALDKLKGSSDADFKELYPGYSGQDVPEKDFYKSGVGLKDEAESRAVNDETARFINQGMRSRPKFEIDRNTDPLFKRYDEVTEKSHSLTETYSGCVELPVGTEDVTKYEEKTCQVLGRQDTINYSCVRTLAVECNNSNAGAPNPFTLSDFSVSGDAGFGKSQSGDNFRFGSRSGNRRGDCSFHSNTISFYVDDVNNITEFRVTEILYDDWLDIWINGSLAFRGIGRHQGTHLDGRYNCEHKRTWSGRAFNAKSFLRRGWNSISVRNQVHGGGHGFFNIRASRKHGCDDRSKYSRVCTNNETHIGGALLSRTCIEGAGTKFVKGFPIYRTCWKWNETYNKLSNPIFTRESLCDQLVADGCGQTNSVCQEQGSGYCKRQRLTFSCPFQTSARHITMCGDQLICPEGDCMVECENGTCTDLRNEGNIDGTEDFKKAATSMAVADELANQIDENTLTVFEGRSRKCGKELTFGALDCCKDKGWASGTLASCQSSEKELGLAKEAKQTIYVGSYKTGGTLNRRKYKVYCIYPSKISRIIMEQGKPQLNLGFGDARSPDCSGLTLEQLGQLNFDAIDFREFYPDAMSQAPGNTPSSDQARSKIQGTMESLREKMNERYPPELRNKGK